jgi:hypothetical protein
MTNLQIFLLNFHNVAPIGIQNSILMENKNIKIT